MNLLDIILICLVTLFLLRGFFRGLVQEVLSLIAIVLAVVLASNYQHVISPHLEMYIASEMTVSILSYLFIFFGTIIAFWLLAKFIRTILDISLLGWIDRLAGGVFGMLEGVLIGLICLLFLQTFMPKSALLQESSLTPRVQHMVALLAEYAPESMRDDLESSGFNLPSPQDVMDATRDAIGLDDDQTQE